MGKTINLSRFLYSYLVCAIWSSTEADDTPLDLTYGVSDIAPDSVERAKADCTKFIQDNEALLLEAFEMDHLYGAASAGNDFWLTRNGHGAGFWDRGLGEVGDALSEQARLFGSIYVYVGDDKKLYFM